MSEPNYVRRFMLVPDGQEVRARSISVGLAGDAGDRMWLFPVRYVGQTAIAYWLTEGWIEPGYAALMQDPALLFGACQQAGLAVTLEQCAALLAESIVEESDGSPLARLAAHTDAEGNPTPLEPVPVLQEDALP